jgi:tetratricopeptide (TPR) repeat protein
MLLHPEITERQNAGRRPDLFLKKGLSPFFRRAAMVVGLTMGWAAPTIAAASNPDYESCQQASDLDIVIASCTRAIDDLSEAAVTRSSIFLRRGNAYVEKSRLDAAIADFSEAISLDPKNSFAYGPRRCLLAQGRPAARGL